MNTNEWIITDPSCKQARRVVIEDQVYDFRENRIINPKTGETELFERQLDYNDFARSEIINACEAFGYSAEQVDRWITEGEEIPLMLECIFEMMN
jgi:hypothetical protein